MKHAYNSLDISNHFSHNKIPGSFYWKMQNKGSQGVLYFLWEIKINVKKDRLDCPKILSHFTSLSNLKM